MGINVAGLLHNSKELSTNLADLSTFSYFFAVFMKNGISMTLISCCQVYYILLFDNVEKLSIIVVDICVTGGRIVEDA
jgi:hypothetical protein